MEYCHKLTKQKKKQGGANVDEAIELWKIEKESNKSSTSKEKLLNDLKEQKLITDEEFEKLTNGEEVTIGSKTISIEDAKTIVEAFKDGDIQVGDYVNYQNPTSKVATVGLEETGYSKTQSYEVNSHTTWRILGLDEEGDNLLLISGSPIKKSKEENTITENPYLLLGGAEAWYSCKATLDKICGIYKNDLAEDARSMRMEDVIRALRNNNK